MESANTSDTPSSVASAAPIQDESHRTAMEDRVNDPSGMFAEPEGYLVSAYGIDGDKFQEDIQQYETKMDEVKAEFDDIWLQLQLFWDLMLRMQPNCITSDAEYTNQAVIFLLDLSIARLLPDTRPKYDPKMAWFQTKCFRRRLRRLELLLRTDMVTCGNSPSILCGCMVAVKRPKYKSNIWTRLFGSSKSGEKSRADDRSYRLRDVAGLIRLEDFLTHISVELERQLDTSNPDNMSVLMHTAIGFMDDEIKMCLKKQDYVTVHDLKAEWVHVLFNLSFRAGVIREVKGIVNDALAFRKKHGNSAHREACELWVPKPKLAQRLTFQGEKDSKGL
ncbi:uncharacterized protein FTOL_13112 [Fusarium torulosum]|uniref:Uncharacterized protein n=1 Tax=Fusarium torulosum TaxID=33205 RepID=A0AAE8SPI8_9HYPO|nr:uncharacterized protein FTOL_13112 [Fusarium torulosum]